MHYNRAGGIHLTKRGHRQVKSIHEEAFADSVVLFLPFELPDY